MATRVSAGSPSDHAACHRAGRLGAPARVPEGRCDLATALDDRHLLPRFRRAELKREQAAILARQLFARKSACLSR